MYVNCSFIFLFFLYLSTACWENPPVLSSSSVILSSTLIQSLSLLLIFKKCLICVIVHLNTLVCFTSHAFCVIFYLCYNFKFQRKICISLQKQTIFFRFLKIYFLLSQVNLPFFFLTTVLFGSSVLELVSWLYFRISVFRFWGGRFWFLFLFCVCVLISCYLVIS